ncbi:MAG: hypothetical protein ACI9J3_001158 [Parvicellaceae bacterium]|jgi:uncharacterized protein (TIGR00730 family)
MNRIAVYCGSSAGVNPTYIEAAKKLGDIMVNLGADLVYGGAQIGLMGVIANQVLTKGGKVYGVIPDFLDEKEITHLGLTELYVTKDMPERKLKMFDLATGFIALPGGIGTFEELFEIFTWRQLNLHQKPIGILNTNGYYDHLIAQLNNSVQEGFLKQSHMDHIAIADDPKALIAMMEAL